MSFVCSKCGSVNQQTSFFCKKCVSRLSHATSYDLLSEDFITDGDQRAVGVLKSMGLLLHIIYSTAVEPRLRDFMAGLPSKANSDAEIELLVTECADVLSLDFLPKVYMANIGQPNALTTGTESRATIVIDSTLRSRLSKHQLRALLGHEMGHIKGKHMMYHSVSEFLERGIVFSSSLLGMNLISIPLRLALLAWHRESESSADRASLIAAGDLSIVASMFAKIIGQSREVVNSNSDFSSFLEAFQSHPHHLTRIKALREFADSAQYVCIERKLVQRKMFEKAFGITCRFCGVSKEVEEVFCPTCGRSLS